MQCPFCGGADSQVKDSRSAEDGGAIRRRRECAHCRARFTTFERVQLRELTVLKRSGARQSFDRAKLTRAITTAARKRPISDEAIDALISEIARDLEASGEAEVTTEALGARVMEALRGLDHVAYVRFASVYRDFRTARDFEAFVEELGRSLPHPDER